MFRQSFCASTKEIEMPALRAKQSGSERARFPGKKSEQWKRSQPYDWDLGAGNRTWTCTALRPLEPESNASANSAIPAYCSAVCVNVCDYIIHRRECQWFFWKKFFGIFQKLLCFLEKVWYTKPCDFICACSSVDRAPASGAGCVGSIPIRRTSRVPRHANA